MGIWNMIKGEFIEVVEWLDPSGDILVWRFPDEDHEIKMGAKLIVRESQAAIFVNEGQIADVFGPGTYSLSTQNMPIMTTLRSWKYGFESPFKAEVYFVSTRNFIDLRWGTQNPIILRDPQMDMVRLRAFGTYSIRIAEPALFVKEIVGTLGCYTTDEIEGQLRSLLVSSFTNVLAGSGIAALDLAANYRTMGEGAREVLQADFVAYGLSLTKFVIENISVPPEVEKMIDLRSQMGISGDMGKLTRFQAAQAIPEAARSGGAGDAMGMGAGLALGQQMVSSMTANLSKTGTEVAIPGGGEDTRPCRHCGKDVKGTPNFCPHCGGPSPVKCPKCSQPVERGAKFCSSCGEKLG